MSDRIRNTHTVSIAENNSPSSETQRAVRTGRTSFSSTARTLSSDSDQSFTERGQIISRHRRRVTLSPSPDEDGQEFGWGATLVSTLHGDGNNHLESEGNDDNDDNNNNNNNGIEWHGEIIRPLNVGSQYLNEITTLRYNLDDASRESLELIPPARSPHRSMSSDSQLQGTWRGLMTRTGNNTSTTTITPNMSSDGTRTIRYDPDVLRWHEMESPVSPTIPGRPDRFTRQQEAQQSSQRAQSHGSTRNITSTEANSGSDNNDNMIEEVVRTIHASRTQPFPGLSRGVGDSDNSSGSSYDEEFLLSGAALGRSSRIPRLSLTASDDQTSTATQRQSVETNRDTFGSRQMSSGQLSVPTAGGVESQSSSSSVEQQQQQQQHRPTSHLPRPITSPTEGGSHAMQTNNKQASTRTERGVRRTSITRIPGPNIVEMTRRGSDGKLIESRRLSMSRSDLHSQGRATEAGGSAVSLTSKQEGQDQSNGFQRSTTSVADNTGIREPIKTYAGAASKNNGLSKTAARSNSAHGSQQGTEETTQPLSTSPTPKTAAGGHGVTGILAAAYASGENNPALDRFAATTEKQQDPTKPGRGSGDKALFKTETSNTQVCPLAGSTTTNTSSPNSLPAHTRQASITERQGLPPASAHHGQHAIFTNLPEPEKAHHAHNRGLSYRFREASLSTVGSIFKSERRHSSVTVTNSDDHGHRRTADAERFRDEAWNFLLRYRTERVIEVSRQSSYLRRLRLRIDLHLMILLFLAYLLTFCDKILFNYARVMGILTELNFTTNDFADAASYFYVASLAFSLPNIYLLAKVPLGKLLAVNLIGWGICTATHAALRNYGGLVALRVLSGIFEAGILPALILLTGQYYTWREQPIRFAYWSSGMAIGQMLSGLLSWAFQHMSPRDSLSSWKTMYLLLGLLTVILGVLILFFVPDTPMKARFLNNEEKVALLEHVKVNQTGIVNRRFHPKQVVEGLLDLGCWLLWIIVVLQLISAGVTMFYSVSLFNGFGYSAERSALLNMPSGAINLVCIFLYAIFVRYWGMRWVVVCFAGIVSTVAAALLFGLTSYGDNRRALLAGVYLINFAPGATMIAVYWLSCNVAGHTKRAYAAAAINAAYALGAIVGPQTFRHQAMPGYRSAKLTLVIVMAVTVALAPLTAAYFWYMNRNRSRKYEGSRVHEDDLDDATAYAGLTDKQNKTFRYRL